MNTPFETPPPLSPTFEDHTRHRIISRRRRRAALATSVVLVFGAGIATTTALNAGAHHDRSIVHVASPAATEPRTTGDDPSSGTSATTTSVAPTSVAPTSSTLAPTTSDPSTPVTVDTPPPVTTLPPASTVPPTAPSCPVGGVVANVVTLHATAINTTTHTWYVWATAVVTNTTPSAVDFSIGIWADAIDVSAPYDLPLDQVEPTGSDGEPVPPSLAPGATTTVQIKSFNPLDSEGANATSDTQPTNFYTENSDMLVRWTDLDLRKRCTPPPSPNAPGATDGSVLNGWPGM